MKFCICIPTYNNPLTIAQVVESCLKETDLDIIVLDDGSDLPVSHLLRPNLRVTIHRHPKNLGKGMALKKCFLMALQRGFSHLVSLDGDGQHFPREIPKLIKKSKDHASALVIGCRFMTRQETPLLSRMGRRISNAWIYFLTGKYSFDSQSGMRVYPLEALSHHHCHTNRFDFEMEILLKSLMDGIDCVEVPIAVHYPKNRVSHFHKVMDNLRIAEMNIRFLFGLTKKRALNSLKVTHTGL